MKRRIDRDGKLDKVAATLTRRNYVRLFFFCLFSEGSFHEQKVEGSGGAPPKGGSHGPSCWSLSGFATVIMHVYI